MTGDQEPYSPARRTLLRGGALLGAVVASGAATGLLAKPALAASTQVNWGWCSLCSEVYFAGNNFVGQGRCPYQPNDGHATPGRHYTMIYNQATTAGLPGTPGYQAGWRFCSNCYAIVWNGTNPQNSCPGGSGTEGAHNLSDSYAYAMPVGLTGSGYQGGWNYCKACGAYYHSNNGPGTNAGYCYYNAVHQTGLPGSPPYTHVSGGRWPYDLIW